MLEAGDTVYRLAVDGNQSPEFSFWAQAGVVTKVSRNGWKRIRWGSSEKEEACQTVFITRQQVWADAIMTAVCRVQYFSVNSARYIEAATERDAIIAGVWNDGWIQGRKAKDAEAAGVVES